ncbi:Gly-Xaa carboxypeptidase [Mycena chlorophos]|uniref:Gly-Xaa carboxypeptidase n=1 Tax=Mycena chlorophos TaxID=658473 RepID=A0A8H6WQ95_MYCCL|nr:Gly-Xaa carboxypeptidase [Mycena chlorophos]
MRGLPLDDHAPKRFRMTHVALPLILLLTIGLASSFFRSVPSRDYVWRLSSPQRDFRLPVRCPEQPAALAPAFSFEPDEEKKGEIIERLRGAVRIRTETFDGAPADGSDPWFDKFYAFEAYLKETFPDVIDALTLEHFATHALLLTWKGTDASLKPLVLMAHQDTVPVPEETLDRWTHPPFEGYLDDEGWIWGRGVVDVKNLLIAELTAVSELLNAGFNPTRTIHLAFGFDEEGGAVRSARHIIDHFETLYGPDSIFLVIDEGDLLPPADPDNPSRLAPPTSDSASSAPLFITPSVGEKGSVNVQLSVNVPGGHSSVPPPHTAIGILSALVTALESNQPEPVLSPKNPWAEYWVCKSEYDPGRLDPKLRELLAHEKTWPDAAKWIANESLGYSARARLLSTTQAVDIIAGGVKVNALPEEAHAIVNHRVGFDDSIAALKNRYIDLLTPIAEQYGLVVVGFDDGIPADTPRYVQLSLPRAGAEASPVAPSKGDVWNVFAATARHLHPNAIVTPWLSAGGTDSRGYTNLTEAIYRYADVRPEQRANPHTVDERLHADAHLSSVAFVHALVQNADQWR